VPRNDKGDIIVSCFASGFCSCLIHQAQLPNKLGNYNVKKSKIKGQKERAKMKKQSV